MSRGGPKKSVGQIAQGSLSTVGDRASSAKKGVSNVASGLSDRASEASSTASELAGSYSETIAGYAGDAQEAVLERSQRVVAGARSSARTELNFVLEDQPLVLAAIGVAAGAALGAILPGTSDEKAPIRRLRESLNKQIHIRRTRIQIA